MPPTAAGEMMRSTAHHGAGVVAARAAGKESWGLNCDADLPLVVTVAVGVPKGGGLGTVVGPAKLYFDPDITDW